MVVTNTVHIPDERRFPALTILSVAELLANAIEFIHSNESVSQLFEIGEDKSEDRKEPGGNAAAD